jgi:type II secretory pathway pseudopilin PulG
VFAYTAYISVAALAIISAVAIGVFWWLKRELGDHTRHDLTHLVTELSRRAQEGYQRGQNAYARARNLNSRAPWSKTQAADQQDSPDGPDQPLTGQPVDGRSPGGRPASPGRQPGPTPGPQPPAPAGAGAPTTAAPTPHSNTSRLSGSRLAWTTGCGRSARCASGW